VVINTYDLDVVVTRGDMVESYHHVSAAVVCDDRLIGRARDSQMVTYWRSSAKPFQTLPFVASGQLDSLRWGQDEIAIACASHGGEPEHVALVERMLQDIDLEEGDLACGVQDPLSQRGARMLWESGERATRLHNNCSGKHAAMLAHARESGWPTRGYERVEHPIQQAILATVEQWTDVPRSNLTLGVDGCGVVVFALPLEAMAMAYARLSRAAATVDEADTGAGRIAAAMLSNPFLIGGTDRFDTVLMEESRGSILCKVGAEGVHCAALLGSGIGIALKVEDGTPRAQYPALLALLQQLGALPSELPPRLAEIARKQIHNTRHEVVGEVLLRTASASK
jgi:L-asparaginase II